MSVPGQSLVLTMRRPLPVLPHQQTFSGFAGMSQKCQWRTSTSSFLLQEQELRAQLADDRENDIAGSDRAQPNMFSSVDPTVSGSCCTRPARWRYRLNDHPRGAFFLVRAALR